MLTDNYNVSTGEISRSFETTIIPRAIVMPAKVWQTVERALQNARPFTYGSYYDPEARVCIVDRQMTKDYQVFADSLWFEISDIRRLTETQYSLMNLKAIENAQP